MSNALHICRADYILFMKIDIMKSAIIVVEDHCKPSVGNHSEKDNNGQDPSLWRFFMIWLKMDFSSLNI